MTTTHDPLAHASATPDVAALITEFTYALDHGPARFDTLNAAQALRYNWWHGKSPDRDGLLHQANQTAGKVVREGAPDTEVNLADEIILAETDMDLFAFEKAQEGAESLHVTQLTAAQVAEAKLMLRWIRKATGPDMAEGAELLSQTKGNLGWAVLQSGWREKWGLVERTVTMDEVFQAANLAYAQWQQVVGQASSLSYEGTNPSYGGTDRQDADRQDARPTTVDALPPVVALPGYLADETLEDQAVAVLSPFVPHLKQDKVKQIVRDLRTEGEATFLDRQLVFKGPFLKTQIPGLDVFVSGGAGDAQSARGWLDIEFYFQADLEAMGVNASWNEEFIEAAIGTAGQLSPSGEAARTRQNLADGQERRIEIWTAKVRQFDEDTGVTGIYCTVFSPHLTPGQRSEGGGQRSERAYFAAHYLQKAAHNQFPYDIARREVIGPDLEDTRGVPRMVRADTNQIKLHQDALGRRAQWDTNPAIIKTGSGWSKIKEPLNPGGDLTAGPGCDAKAFSLDRGNPQVGANFIDRIEKSARRRFALPNNGQEGDHPSLWQLRQSRQSGRFLNCLRSAYGKLLVLCYEELEPAELAQIIGRPPLLTLPELLRCQVTLKFEPRSLDSDWTETVLKFITQIMTWDKGGLIDTAPLMRIGLSYIDTTIIDEILRSPQGAQAQLYRKVEQDVTSILLGNPPPLGEMDASAGMQLQMAFAVIGKNQRYQKMLEQDPQAQENLKTYVENLQHSQQQTEISPVQGRLGVAEMPQRPVTKGNALQTAGS